ncbi:unnamed protein product [Brassica napus]|uniref:(rape) hypothetical protein n=2 Tax=Brassica napus TaxID=3708 RepID=A0A816KAD9_BRANA|nr:unnamed protein product [Brassica napus]
MSPIFYFLLALTAFLATRADAGGAVRDSDGDIISGGSYYVKTVFLSEGGGGLSLTPSSDSPCPLYIGQEWSRLDWGIPVNFSNWKSRVGFVPESENLNIEMDVKATVCVKSTYWWLSADKGSKTWLEAGPKPDKPGQDSFFQIKKANGGILRGYNIAFCPNDSDCVDVSVYLERTTGWRLGLGPIPIEVEFVKATRTETLSKTMSII